MMEAPKCLVCGERHWSRQACPAQGRPMKDVTPVTRKSVTAPSPVTTETPLALQVATLERRVAEIEAMLMVGDRALPAPKPSPKSSAERVRAYRQRKKGA